jgi:hypothetical protein
MQWLARPAAQSPELSSFESHCWLDRKQFSHAFLRWASESYTDKAVHVRELPGSRMRLNPANNGILMENGSRGVRD